MTKNIKRMFFVLAIITLLATVGAVCAADDTNTTTTVDNSVSEVATVADTTSNHIATEPITTTSNKKVDTKTIEKENKNLKTATKTVEVYNYTDFLNTITNAVEDSYFDEYVLNLNPGLYQITANKELTVGTNKPNIIINANNQSLTATRNSYIRFNNGCNITINDAIITHSLQNYNNNILVCNSNVSNQVTNRPGMNLSFINSYIYGNGIITNTQGNLILQNSTITSSIRNNGGNLTICDDVIFGENLQISGEGAIITNRTDIAQYLMTLNGTYTIANTSYSLTQTNYGNLTIINTTINGQLTNSGNLTITNSTQNQRITNNVNLTITNSTLNNTITNNGNITISDDVIFGENLQISGAGAIITNRTDIVPYLNTYNGTYTLENTDITSKKTNYGNLTIINTTINGQLTNSGNLTITNSTQNQKITNNANLTITNSTLNNTITNNANLTITNSTLNNTITNKGNITISDDVIFGENLQISGAGAIITNRTDIVPYLNTYNGTYTLENTDITSTKTNYGELTIRNSTLNATIDNRGTLIICDDVIIGENCRLYERSGIPIIINDTSRIVQYIVEYNGTYTLENCNRSAYTLINDGNLTLRNVTLNVSSSNYGNLTVYNSTLNQSITNQGTIILADDVIIGENLKFTGNGEVISNNTEIIPLLPIYTGNIVLENLTISDSKTNNGNLTIINCTTSSITNNGNLTIINCTTSSITNNGNLTVNDSIINQQITNNGNITVHNTTINQQTTNNGTLNITNSTLNRNIINTGILILSDDVTLKSNIKISGTGIVIAENMSPIFRHLQSFNGEASITIEEGYDHKPIDNYGKLTIENSTMQSGTTGPITNHMSAQLIFKNSSVYRRDITNDGQIEFQNATFGGTIVNNGVIVISDDTILTSNGRITGTGDIIINDTQRLADLLSTYTGNIVLNNKTINENKVNNGNLTLNNCTIWAPITNNGQVTVSDDTIFQGNGKITGTGEIITNNITRILPYIDTINGNYTITDTTLNKTYAFNGNVTLNNVTTTHKDNANFGTLYLNNCTVDVGEENIFLDNMGTVYVDKNTKITGKIEDIGGETIYEPIPEPKTYIVTNRTAKYYFSPTDGGRLTSIVNPGDILDIQGTIAGIPELNNICINKPVNIISTTQDANISLNTTSGDLSGENPGNMFSITKDGAGTNITGIYFYNTQLWLYNTNHVTLDNISAVVENQAVGSGVGQTSIRANSSYITVKNSYFYTKDNGGSSSLVLAWADNCDIINNTIQAVGKAGNMIYITTYNIDIPSNIIYNSHNNIINNTLTGPEEAAGICYGIAISGTDNLIDGNTINYSGTGITEQWGSGSSSGEGDSQFTIIDNTISNNKLYGGCGISKVHGTVYNNYMEGKLSASGTAYNNTAQSAQITTNSSEFYNNTINGVLTIDNNVHNIKIHDNIINGNITIPQSSSNNTLTNNNITGSIKLDGSNNNIINNTIKSTTTYTITGNKQSSINNTITDNYLEAKELLGDKSVQIDNDQNTIEYNMPYETILQVDTTEFRIGQNTTIQASIYYGREILTNITKGKVTFKVNGKTLKDENGKVIYAKVVNGIATIENFLVPDTWKEGMTIKAIYSGSVECEKLTSEKTNITILADEPTITTEDITTTAGDKITLKATITDNDKVINTVKVVFKINGKSIKDADGKVIYAKVVNNQVIVEYTLPESYKVGTYTITAVLISSNYERLQDNKILTVTS